MAIVKTRINEQLIFDSVCGVFGRIFSMRQFPCGGVIAKTRNDSRADQRVGLLKIAKVY